MIGSTRKDIVGKRTTSPLQPCQQACSGVRHQLELHRPTCFRLNDERTGSDMATKDDIADPHPHHIATTQLAVDRQVKQRSIPQSLVLIEEEANGPDLSRLERTLGTHLAPAVPGGRLPAIGSNSDVPIAFSPWPSWPRRGRARGSMAFQRGHLRWIARCIQFELRHSKSSRSAVAQLQTLTDGTPLKACRLN